MKRILTFLLCLSLLVSLLCACATQTQTPVGSGLSATEEIETDEPAAPSAPQSFGLSYLADYSMNPFTCESLVNRAAFSLLYEPLFSVSTTFQAEPVLCDTFTASEDAMTYRIRLLSGVTFSDGSALSAADVAASYQAAMKSGIYAGQLSHIRRVMTDGDDTVVFLLDTPYENLPLILDVPIVKADTAAAARPLGTGPYALSEAGGTLSLRRVQSWWQDISPVVEFDTITLNAAQSSGDIRDAFEFGSTDLVLTDPNSGAAVGYQCDYELWNCPTTTMLYLGFNKNRAPFSSATLRSAVTYAIDRDTIATEYYGGFAVAASLPCSPLSVFYDSTLAASYSHAPAKYAAAVQTAGLGVQSAILIVPSADTTRVEVAQRIATALQIGGIGVTVKAMDESSYQSAIKNGNFDLYLGEVRLSNNFDLSAFFSSDGSLRYGGMANSSLATLCDAVLQNSAAYYDLHSAVMEDAAICPILFKAYAVYATRGTIGTLHPSVDNVFHRNGIRSLSDANLSALDTPDEPDASDAPDESSAPDESNEPDESGAPAASGSAGADE